MLIVFHVLAASCQLSRSREPESRSRVSISSSGKLIAADVGTMLSSGRSKTNWELVFVLGQGILGRVSSQEKITFETPVSVSHQAANFTRRRAGKKVVEEN